MLDLNKSEFATAALKKLKSIFEPFKDKLGDYRNFDSGYFTHHRKIRHLSKTYSLDNKLPETFKYILLTIVVSLIILILVVNFGYSEVKPDGSLTKVDNAGVFDYWKLLFVIPVILILWLLYRHNIITKKYYDNKKLSVKKFQQIKEHLTTPIDDKTDSEITSLKVVALHDLRPYFRGEFGDSLHEESFNILMQILRNQHTKIVRSIIDKSLPLNYRNIQDAILNCELTKNLNRIVSEDWFSVLINHDFSVQNISLVGVDLQGRYLQHKTYKVSLDLSKSNFQGSNLLGAQMYGVNLKWTKMHGAKMQEIQLQGADMERSILQGANLSKAQLERANLYRSELQGVNLHMSHLEGADLYRAKLQYADLSRAHLQGAGLERANLKNANLYRAELQNADLKRTQLCSADFEKAKLQGANLERSNVQGASFKMAQLHGVYLERINGQGASFLNANMPGVNLFRAKLQGSNFKDAQLQGADLEKSQMQGAYLENTKFQGASLLEAQIQGATSVNEIFNKNFSEWIYSHSEIATNLDGVSNHVLSKFEFGSLKHKLNEYLDSEAVKRITQRISNSDEPLTLKDKEVIMGEYDSTEADKWLDLYNNSELDNEINED